MSEREVDPALIEALIRRLDALEERLDALDGRIEAIEGRGDGPEADLQPRGTSDSATAGLDERDMAVLDGLQPGQRVSRRKLLLMYRNRTDITRERTAKRRVKNLIARPFFETGGATVRYLGIEETDE
jgi:hypothetical protein